MWWGGRCCGWCEWQGVVGVADGTELAGGAEVGVGRYRCAIGWGFGGCGGGLQVVLEFGFIEVFGVPHVYNILNVDS